ncbi:MAG TPA: GNAT family N-acetyltransferase, partial [Roseiflexaceae bacterium]|nr:GNAT family N-acetyltransferase [Roseiflexaceae bacterium]
QATLDDLVIAPAYRRRGLGAALVQAAIHLARIRGCTALAVLAAHDEARDLLVASGFAAGAALTLELAPASDA